MKTILFIVVIALVMGGGGLGHLLAPAFFEPFVFDPLPKATVVLLTGLVQIAVAIAVLIPQTRRFAGLAFAVLCLGYMPLHIWDLFRPDPVIAPLSAAAFRIAVQIVFIWIGWSVWKEAPRRHA